MTQNKEQTECELPFQEESLVDEHYLYIIEAYIFASDSPVEFSVLRTLIPHSKNLDTYLNILQKQYEKRGLQLVKRGTAWCFRTNPYYGSWLSDFKKQEKKLTPVTLEILAIIAYHQPITRGEIENIRGVSISKTTLDTLLEHDWIAVKGIRKVIGKPMLWGTTTAFLDHFGLTDISELPGLNDLRNSGLLDIQYDE